MSVDLGLAGVRVGHWTDSDAGTGCTVVLFPEGTVASGEVRGGAPATREFALLDPARTVARLDALVLTGGSAFGLAAADGVVAFCEEQGVGFPTVAGNVPIVVALALFDLVEREAAAVRPSPSNGRAAAEAATAGSVEIGRVGAGAGATVGKWRGREHRAPGGLGAAVARRDKLVVAALVAVNAAGDIDDGTVPRAILDGSFDGWPEATEGDEPGAVFGNTTIGLVATNGRLDKLGCYLVSQSAHDGFARALFPAHTRGDGDAVVAAATGLVDAAVDTVRTLAVVAVEAAIRSVGGPGPVG
ncbi:MAG TPA: P1 family peptidase [Acidimicrobiales bacterium]|jgi:L-aminopeptidase/D-esterase-like protein|nr:P1 family peptidase [Acidimicrobiales bacterium]